MQELAEILLQVAVRPQPEGLAHDAVGNGAGIGKRFAGDPGKNLDVGQAVEKRDDLRLDRDDRSVRRPRVAP